MKLAIRENMVPGGTLSEQLRWLEQVGLDGIELHGSALDLPEAELRTIFAESPVGVAAIEAFRHCSTPTQRSVPRRRT